MVLSVFLIFVINQQVSSETLFERIKRSFNIDQNSEPTEITAAGPVKGTCNFNYYFERLTENCRQRGS